MKQKNLISLMHTRSKDKTEYNGNHIVPSWRKYSAARYLLNFMPRDFVSCYWINTFDVSTATLKLRCRDTLKLKVGTGESPC